MQPDVREEIIRRYDDDFLRQIAVTAVEKTETGGATPAQRDLADEIMAAVWERRAEEA